MRRNKPRPEAKVIFDDPFDKTMSCEGDPKIVSDKMLRRLKQGSNSTAEKIAKKMKCVPSNVRVMLASHGTNGPSIRVLAMFANACNCDLVLTYRPRNPKSTVTFG